MHIQSHTAVKGACIQKIIIQMRCKLFGEGAFPTGCWPINGNDEAVYTDFIEVVR